jgi:hypothetical protein
MAKAAFFAAWIIGSCLWASVALAGVFSAKAVELSGSTVRLASPDGKALVEIGPPHGRDDDRQTVLKTPSRVIPINKGANVNAEVRWSSDSRYVFVTASDGGNVGTYQLFIADTHRLGRVLDASPIVRRAFGHPVRCGGPDPVNVAGVDWLDSGRLLVAAQIPPHSVCDSFGTFRAYEIDVSNMKVVRTYDQLAAKAKFGNALGSMLRNADDGCIRQPSSCFVSTNHQMR